MVKLKSEHIVKSTLSILIALVFGWYIYAHWSSIIGSIKNLSLPIFIIIVLGQLWGQITNSELLRITVEGSSKSKISTLESFKITVVSSFVNFFTPVIGGLGVKATYLKKKHKINYSEFLSSLYAIYLISFLSGLVTGFIGVILAKSSHSEDSGLLLLVVFGTGIIAITIFMIFGSRIVSLLQKTKPRKRYLIKLFEKLQVISQSWDELIRHKKFVWKIVLCVVSSILSSTFVYWLIFNGLGISISIPSILIFIALATISLLFNITPGNIGIRETIYISAYSLTGIRPEAIIAFSIVERTSLILLTGTLTLFFGKDITNSSKTERGVHS